MAGAIRFALGGSVELQHGVDADFPDSLAIQIVEPAGWIMSSTRANALETVFSSEAVVEQLRVISALGHALDLATAAG